MEKRFEDRVVLITSSAGGIGQALVDRFAAEGAKLVLVDREEHALRAQAAALDIRALPLVCDVSDPAHVEAAMRAALHRFAKIDVAVLNAGIEGRLAELEELKSEDFDRVMAVNVRGVFL